MSSRKRGRPQARPGRALRSRETPDTGRGGPRNRNRVEEDRSRSQGTAVSPSIPITRDLDNLAILRRPPFNRLDHPCHTFDYRTSHILCPLRYHSSSRVRIERHGAYFPCGRRTNSQRDLVISRALKSIIGIPENFRVISRQFSVNPYL
jgi:hypothetical protein